MRILDRHAVESAGRRHGALRDLVARRWLPAAIGLATAGAVVVAPAAASASVSAWSLPVVGHVYLDDNTAGTNTIAGFDRHLDGSLTPLAGSPFVAGGAGAGVAGGLASEGALQV